MIVDFSQTMKSLEGEVIKDEAGKPVSLKSVCQVALLGHYNDEQVDGAEKARRWLLAIQLNGADSVDFPAEDIAKMKLLVGKAYGPLVVGQAYKMLDG